MKWWRNLFQHYEAYHAYGPPRLKYAGYFGLAAYSAFYFLRFTRPGSPPFDDLVLRLAGIVLFALLAVPDRWPRRFRPYYIGFSYVTMLYGLPFFSVLTALQRGGGVPAMSNTFIVLCFLVLLTDWRNTLVMLSVGIAAAAGIYVATTPHPQVPMDLVAQLPAYALIVVGGNLFKFSTEQIDTERKLRATQALAGSIAHEMRNPLSQIRYSLEGMQQALPSPAATAQVQTLSGSEVHALYRHLAESELAVRRGLQVIAMTLDEVTAKPMDTSAFAYLSAVQATHKAVEEYAFDHDAERSRVSVQVIDDFTFRGDETAYLFVLFNLIKNALYYLALFPHAQVTVTVGDHLVRVRDTGPGIPPEALPGLFQPFSSSGKSGGTGLGLAYCRRVMRAFGGDIDCESVVGEFTQFTLRFPPVNEEESRAHRMAVLESARATFAGKRLLIVDDDAVQFMSTRNKLLPLGAQLDQAGDGQGALDALERRRYDLVLLDLNMPGMDGYAVAERIRQGDVPDNRDVRIVAHTSEPAHLARIKTQKAGIDGLVNKPCDQLPLVQALRFAFEQPASGTRGGVMLAGRRILLADDHPYNRMAVAAYLKHAGATVLEADDGRAVLELLGSASRCDAVLMDLNMPGMDGLDAARAIRRGSGAWCQLPIIALTAHSDEETVQAARDAGMNDFITKPVEARVLYATLGRLIHGVSTPGFAPSRPIRPEANDDHGAVLNVERLESYQRIGMLQELLDDYLPEIARLVDTLERSVGEQDLPGCVDALHSLLGMSGEAGAQSLHRLVRGFYGPMVETRAWPSDKGWLAQIEAAAAQAETALRTYRPSQSPVTAG